MIKEKKGITLIALVVTIVVLLILATISIAMLGGDNGIINQAQKAKEETEISEEKEKVEISAINAAGKDKWGEITEDNLEEELNKNIGKRNEDYILEKSGNEFLVTYISSKRNYYIDSNGNVNKYEIVEDETPWELAGSGTETDPYLIESIEDLVAFSNNVNSGEQYSGKYIKLTTDLDFNISFSYNDSTTKVLEKTNRIIEKDSNGIELKTALTSGTGFNPIGGASHNIGFYGNFDGNGKKIKNIYINRPDEKNVALFSNEASGSYGDIRIGGNIKNLEVSGQIVGGNIVGGIAATGISVENSCSRVNVTGSANVGGIGGSSTIAINCYNTGEINLNSENYNGSDYSAGGIIGNGQSGQVKNCYNSGTVKVSKNGFMLGGIVGYTANISNSYNLGKLQYMGEGKIYYLAGIIGSLVDRNIIKNCYNISSIDSEKALHFGGISGATIENINECYYLKGSANGGIDGQDIEGKAMQLEKSQMPSVINVVMTDNENVEYNGQMVDIWKEDAENINNGNPILFWQ